jgi:predicted glycosyltransferase
MESTMASTPRLDILLYAHDGRGLGHASRTIAVGMALRRLFPHLRVLFLSGGSMAQELIGPAPLDWIKLPSYATIVENGTSRGSRGKSNFEDNELGHLRAQQIRQTVRTYRPRLVLADHTPQGKHKELLPALEDGEHEDTQWILGMRGVVGQVGQVRSPLAATTYQRFYSSLLWYGDSRVLGTRQLEEIQAHLGSTPLECGYASRMKEWRHTSAAARNTAITGTISVPWFGEQTPVLLQRLHAGMRQTRNQGGQWHLYLDNTHPQSADFAALFAGLPGCRVEAPGRRYMDSFLQSRCAIIYGGYNSLMDVLSLSMPAIVLLRGMQDQEQQYHLEKLLQAGGNMLTPLPENSTRQDLATALASLRSPRREADVAINLDGAAAAAHHLAAMLNTPR